MHLLQAVSLAVAVLVIGALVVTSALLFSRHKAGNESQTGAPTINITLSSCASQPMSVLVDLCTHNQLTDLLQSRKIDKYVLVLERAYLDSNQLLITYRVFSQSTGRQTLADLNEAITDTVITTSQGQSFQPSASGSPATGPQVVQFSTPSLAAQTQTLQLHVRVNTIRIESLPPLWPTPPPQPTAVHSPVTFNFTLQYHGGLVVTPHQTVTVKALSVTLERILISPSETIIDGTTQGMLPDSPDYTFSLNAAGRNSIPSFSGFGGNGNPFSIGYYDGLLGQHGTWTFEISLTTSSTVGPLVFVFHFRVL